jgi:hypothetical protein
MRDVKRSLRLVPRREIGTLIPVGAARKTIPPRRAERSTHHPARATPIDFHHPARAGQYTHRPAPRQKIDTHPPRAAPVLEMPSGPTIDFPGPNAHG